MSEAKRIQALEEGMKALANGMNAILAKVGGVTTTEPSQVSEAVVQPEVAPQSETDPNLAIRKDGEEHRSGRNVVSLLKGAKLLKFLADLAKQGLLKFDSERELALVRKTELTKLSGSTAIAKSNRQLLTEQGFGGLLKANGKRSMASNFYIALSGLEERGVTFEKGETGWTPKECEPKAPQPKAKKAEPVGISLADFVQG